MTAEEYAKLLWICGLAAGHLASLSQVKASWDITRFVNRMNADNPDFDQYEIPEWM